MRSPRSEGTFTSAVLKARERAPLSLPLEMASSSSERETPIQAPRPGARLGGPAGLGAVAAPPQAEAEIHTIGVDPDHQRRGIGRALLRGLLAVADEIGATVFLEVRTDNEAARALYEAEGFTVVGLRKRYYRPSGADAYTMRRERRA